MVFKMSWRIWLLIIVLILALLCIAPWKALEKGIVIKSVEKNSTAFNNGLRQGMVITEINAITINNEADYSNFILETFTGINNTQKISIKADNTEFIFLTDKAPEITIGAMAKSNLKTGLDLSGGAKAHVRPFNVSVSSSEMDDLIEITKQRFNLFGLRDISIRKASDLSGNQFMIIEIAGATPTDLEELVGQQGKFEAKIGNQTVFIGGKGDIAHVETSGQSSGIEGCSSSEGGKICRFRFLISLTEAAAKRHSDITGNLSISQENPQYLSEKLSLYIDDALVDSLFISKDLKGLLTTEIVVSGSGAGTTEEEAFKEASNNMNKLQTVLKTGSLPYKLEIVKLDTISPVLGNEFLKNLFKLAIIVFVLISLALFIKYRKIKITSAVILTMFAEAFITLGIAALIKWNLDAPSIAGIIAGMGTGVNDQIVIIDESVSNITLSLKDRIKRAFFIIFGAFFTIFAAMIPLLSAGAGMLKGFAITTLAGVTVGILITRPAFAEILKKMQGE